MPVNEVEIEAVKYLSKNESKLVKALEMYYSRFGIKNKSVTFNEAAHKNGVNSAFLVDYMFFRGNYRLGMPSDRDEALEFLDNLRSLKKDLGYY